MELKMELKKAIRLVKEVQDDEYRNMQAGATGIYSRIKALQMLIDLAEKSEESANEE